MSADAEREFVRVMGERLADREERQRAGELAYKALKATGQLSSHRLLAYRCPNARRCLLLDVVNFPEPVGPLLVKPRYKLSAATNEAASNEAGRAANTEDGRNHWKAAYMVPEALLNVVMNCDHIKDVAINKARVQADLDAGHTEVILTPADHCPDVG